MTVLEAFVHDPLVEWTKVSHPTPLCPIVQVADVSETK